MCLMYKQERNPLFVSRPNIDIRESECMLTQNILGIAFSPLQLVTLYQLQTA